MESWQKVFREGFAPLLTVKNLEDLRRALVEDDPRLIQKATTLPSPLQCVKEWDCEGACLFTFPGVMDMGGFQASLEELRSAEPGTLMSRIGSNLGACKVKDAEEFFARMCYEIDKRIGEPAGCRHLLNVYDDLPRDEMRKAMLGEVQFALAERLREEAKNDGDHQG